MNNEDKILQALTQLQTNMSQMQTDMSQMQTSMSQMQTSISQLQTDMSQMQATVTNIDQRTARLEEATERLDQRTARLEVNQENTIIPHTKLLAEGQMTIQDQIKRLSVIDRMQDDIATLKTAVRFLSEKVIQLEEAAV